MHFKINARPQLNNTLQGGTVIFQVKDDVALPQRDKPAEREWHVRRAWGQLSAAHVGSGTYSCTFTNVADTDSPCYGGAHAWQSKPAQFQLSNAMGSSKTRAACNVGHSHVTLPWDSLLLTLYTFVPLWTYYLLPRCHGWLLWDETVPRNCFYYLLIIIFSIF